MKRFCLSFAWLALLTGPTAVCAQTPAEWAAKLGSRNYPERETAARALEKLGKPALGPLQELAKSSDLETKRRAVLLLDRIEERLVQAELRAATSTQFRFDKTPLMQTIVDIESQTGMRIVGVPSKNPTTLDTGVLPFWRAWQTYCGAAKICEHDFAWTAVKLKRLDAEQAAILLETVPDDWRDPVAMPQLRLSTTAVGRRYAVDDRHSVRVRVRWNDVFDVNTPVLAVEVRPEPRLELVSAPHVELTRLVDAEGRDQPITLVPLIPGGLAPRDRAFLSAYVGEVQFSGLLHLKPLAWKAPPRSLKEVHGRVRVDVRARPRLLEVPDLFKSVGKVFRGPDGITLKIVNAEIDDSELHVRLHLDDLGGLTPTTPEQAIVRIRPGMVAVRGAIDVAMERLEMYEASGRKCRLISSRYDKVKSGTGYDADLVFALSSDRALTLALTKAPRTVALEMPFLVREVAWK